MIKSMIASSKDNDSDSDSEDTAWRANLSDAEQMARSSSNLFFYNARVSFLV
jgi:hypothetical protein